MQLGVQDAIVRKMKTGSAIILFKPDAEKHLVEGIRRIYPVRELAVAMLTSAGVEIVDHTRRQLEPNEVRTMYANALKSNPKEDAIYGIQWKQDVVDHLSSTPIDAYLLDDAGQSAEYKAKLIKSHLRSVLSTPDNVVQNIAHVPDADEFMMARSILFTYE